MTKLIIPFLLFLFACSEQPKNGLVDLPDSVNLAGKRIVINKQFYWTGTINNKIPVFLCYSLYDKVIVGEITYLNTKARQPIKVLGTIEEDKEYRLLEFESNGNISGVITGKPNEKAFKGSWVSPKTKKELLLNLVSKDTTVSPIDVKTDANDIFGNYQYQYSENGYQGNIEVEKVNNNKISFSIFSVTGDPARNVAEVEKDTVQMTGNSFVYKIPESDNCEFRVTFYKGFATVNYTKGYCNGQFGVNATVDGIFLRVK